MFAFMKPISRSHNDLAWARKGMIKLLCTFVGATNFISSEWCMCSSVCQSIDLTQHVSNYIVIINIGWGGIKSIVAPIGRMIHQRGHGMAVVGKHTILSNHNVPLQL